MSGSSLEQTFVQRAIDVAIELGAGKNFTEAPGQNIVTLTGLRVSVTISNQGIVGAGAQIRIWGMTGSQMAQLSTLGVAVPYIQGRPNLVTIMAGDKAAQKPLPTVFKGFIASAWIDFDAMPEVFFNIMSNTTFIDSLGKQQPVSYSGSVAVADIMEALAKQMGRGFTNWGVTGIYLSNPYLANSPYEQVKKIAQHAGIFAVINETTGALEIWPRGGTRGSDNIPIISKDTGLIDYPTYFENGIAIRSIFNPAIRWGVKVDVQSEIPTTNDPNTPGSAMVNGIKGVGPTSANIEAEVPGGSWEMSALCYIPGTIYNPGPF